METKDDMEKRPRARRRWGRVLAWVGGSLLGLALAGCAVGAYWLYAWKLGSMEFHEGWTPQERQVLADFDDYVCSPERRADCLRMLHGMGGLLSLQTPQEYEEGLSWWERVEDRVSSDMLLKCLGGPTRDLLKQAAATGNADVCCPECGASLVALAMKFDCLDAVRLLAGKGADLNRLFNPAELLWGKGADSAAKEGVLSSLVGGCSGNNIFRRGYSCRERKECLGFLLDHGARWDNPGQRMEMYWALPFSSFLRVDELEGLFTYALQRGYRVNWKELPDFFKFIAPHSCSVRVLEELERRGQLGEDFWQTCPLQRLCRYGVPNEHVVKSMEWLLSRGADPNAAGEDSSRPLCTLVDTINSQAGSMDVPDEEDRRVMDSLVQELEILLRHGAGADKTLKLDKDNMDPRVPELLTKHGAEWEWREN